MQIICPNCHELSLPHDAVCRHCGQPFNGSEPTMPALPPLPLTLEQTLLLAQRKSVPKTPANPELRTLLLVEVCLFVVLWALTISGLLRSFAWAVTHPILLLIVAVVALVATGLYLSERFTGETPPAALISTRDLMTLCWAGTALMGVGQGARLLIPPPPRISDFKIVTTDGGASHAEVWVQGRGGDELLNIVDFVRGKKLIVGAIVRHPSAGSDPLPTTWKTPQGELPIRKYHLMAGKTEIDTLDGER